MVISFQLLPNPKSEILTGLQAIRDGLNGCRVTGVLQEFR